jgi:N-acetylglutamate synthase-like GNAT family acetyltransferase
MRAVPLSITKANAHVAKHHRHNKPTQGGLFAVGVAVRGETVGVAIVGRPVARMLDDGETCEVVRLCVSDGVSHLHVCSNLYGRCIRIAREMGYRKVITYTLEEESGASLRAAGFAPVSHVRAAATWSVPSRPRTQTVRTLFGDEQQRPTGPKTRWERTLTKGANHGVDSLANADGAGKEADLPLPRR